MFKDTKAFSGFSVDNLDAAKKFYNETLGIMITEEHGMFTLQLATGGEVLVYAKDAGHVPATYTMLNFPVENIDAAVDDLTAKGIKFEVYEDAHQDDKGIARGKAANMGPDIAWFKDPAGNVLSVLQN